MNPDLERQLRRLAYGFMPDFPTALDAAPLFCGAANVVNNQTRVDAGEARTHTFSITLADETPPSSKDQELRPSEFFFDMMR